MFHVKHNHHSIDPARVASALVEVGVAASSAQIDLLVKHASLVLETNATMNLTRIIDPVDVVELHIQDSLAPMALVDMTIGPVADIGSGAGYPGIPLAIMDCELTLCESVRKKAAFLSETVEALGLDCSVMALRAEELAVLQPNAFSVVTARAVSSLPALVELSAPLLSHGGCLVAMKGRLQAAEWEQADRVGEICGMRRTATLEYSLPRGDQRSVYVYRKTGTAQIALPRRPGMAQRQPLGQLA